MYQALTCLAVRGSGLFSGLRDALHCLSDLVVEYVRIARRGFQISVVECALYQFKVASFAQQFGREIVTEVVEAEAGHAGTLAQSPPGDLDAGIGEGIARLARGRRGCAARYR